MKNYLKKLLTMALVVTVIMTLCSCGVEDKISRPADETTPIGQILDNEFDEEPMDDDEEVYEVPLMEVPEKYEITDAVVVSMEYDSNRNRYIFECAADIDGYPGGKTPFVFRVKEDRMYPEDCEYAKINITFDGILLETDPLGLGEVFKVTGASLDVSPEELAECQALFEPDDEPILEDDPILMPDGYEINNAVVVSKRYNEETKKFYFECAADIGGYPGGKTPFTFSVTDDRMYAEDCDFAKINILCSGEFMETYPMQLGEVYKVTGASLDVSPEELAECQELFGLCGLPLAPEQDNGAADMLTCKGYVVNAFTTDDGKAEIWAYVRLGSCGVMDPVIIWWDKDKLTDSSKGIIAPEDIEPGRYIEFDHDGTFKDNFYSSVSTPDGISDVRVLDGVTETRIEGDRKAFERDKTLR